MSSKISSIGLILLVFIVVLVSGCTSTDSLNDIKVTESGDVKHFEGKEILFNAPNTWGLGQMENQTEDYLFSIGRGTGENLDLINFHKGNYNNSLSDYVKSAQDNLPLKNWTITSEKELTVDGVPAYQITYISNNQTIISTAFMKNGIMYNIYAVPSPGKNQTSIEPDLEMVLNSFHAT